MTKGEGLVALLYAFKGILEAGVMTVLSGVAIVIFFWIIVRYILQKMGKQVGGPKVEGNQILFAIFILFVIFGLYSLIALTGSIFGVNASPSGGLYIQ
jgi:uncharacterized membrane protein